MTISNLEFIRKNHVHGYFKALSVATKEDNIVARENSQQNFFFPRNDIKESFGHMNGIMESQTNKSKTLGQTDGIMNGKTPHRAKAPRLFWCQNKS